MPAGPRPWMLMYDGVLFATYSNHHRPEGRRRARVDGLADGHGVAPGRSRPADVDRHGQPRPRDDRPARLSRAVSNRRDVRLHPDRRSPASARSPDAGIRRVADSAHRQDRHYVRGRAGRRGGARPGRVHASAVGRGKSVAPLSHHTLDSTHIAMGVIAVAVDRGPWVFESSVFQSGEPDENRWDLVDFGPLDSWSARVSGTSPRAHGNCRVRMGTSRILNGSSSRAIHRTTASASWFRTGSNGFTAATFAFGRNDKEFHGNFHAALAEATRKQGVFSSTGVSKAWRWKPSFCSRKDYSTLTRRSRATWSPPERQVPSSICRDGGASNRASAPKSHRTSCRPRSRRHTATGQYPFASSSGSGLPRARWGACGTCE